VLVVAAAADAEGPDEDEEGGGGVPEDGAAADPVRRAAVRHRPRAQHPVPHRPGPARCPASASACLPPSNPSVSWVPACSPR
jgi:hypothetical protein